MKYFWLILSLAPASTIATMMGTEGQQDMAGAGGYYFTPVSSPVSPSPYVFTAQAASSTDTNTMTTTTTTLSGAGTVTLANAQVFCPNRLPNAIDNCWFLMTIISTDSYVFPLFSCLLRSCSLMFLQKNGECNSYSPLSTRSSQQHLYVS
jgi:hypothetical protein